MGHKKKDPHQKLDTLERASGWGTLIILAGIVLEIWLFFGVGAHDPRERIISLVANSLIALGLIVEYVAIRLTIIAAGEAKVEADERISAANKQAAAANERAAELEKEAAELQVKLRPLVTQRSFDNQQLADVVMSLARFPTLRVNVIPIWTTKEVTEFARHLAGILNLALVHGGAPPKYEGNLTPVLLQSADGWLGKMPDGVSVKYRQDAEAGREFSIELVRLLEASGIAARVVEDERQRPQSVAVFVGAVPPAG